NELVRYINDGKNAVSSPPDVKSYTEFFARQLKKAHHLIHISITTSMSDDYRIAYEAAKSFDNVTVINSECLSSAAGILVLIAHKLAQQNIPVPEIVKELENVKQRLRCSFVIDTTEFMAKKGLVSPGLDKIARALGVHPGLRIKDDKSGIGSIWMGSTEIAYKRYIHSAFPVDIIPDSDVVFVTYVDIPSDTLKWIKEEISKIAYFEHVVFQQASAAISSNCGPGTFGILYFVKSNKSYNIASYITEEDEGTDEFLDRYEETEETPYESEEEEVTKEEDAKAESGELPWYKKIDFIDGDAAINNSGSEDALKAVLKLFLDSLPAKSAELKGFYSSENWGDYTIKIHALKSSARLIGATELSDKAQKLENAGKEGDTDYIRDNFEPFMAEYEELGKLLSGVLSDDAGKEETEDNGESAEEKPVADEYLMESVYEGLRDAADAMDSNTIEEILKELEDYTIPGSEREKYDAVREKAAKYDYYGMLELLGDMNGNNSQN
ncbi:MAG: Hpt domain-containing protein, partial [Lachnospiraceae bacterium]|nr:Hpt domain-containing protein [Lachnospiraceae bacterium]